MRSIVLAIAVLAYANPASAQLGSILKRVKQVEEVRISDSEEVEIGKVVSEKIRARFGVVQDPAVHKYVTLVGTLLAQASARPNLPYKFIVLDTDALNAFASPGGFVHITKGALALIANEAELAAVLGHEITHITEKHTIKAIEKGKAVQIGADETLSGRRFRVEQIANRTYEMLIENAFSRDDELEADEVGVRLASKGGYAAGGLADFLARLAERNKAETDRNGLFASHPQTVERIEKIRKQVADEKLTGTATVESRYKAAITYEAKPLAEIAAVAVGAVGLAGSDSSTDAKKNEDSQKDQSSEQNQKPEEKDKKKKGFGLGSLKRSLGGEKQSAQVTGSGGARGVRPDRDATGGSNPELVDVSVTATDLEEFKKGIVA